VGAGGTEAGGGTDSGGEGVAAGGMAEPGDDSAGGSGSGSGCVDAARSASGDAAGWLDGGGVGVGVAVGADVGVLKAAAGAAADTEKHPTSTRPPTTIGRSRPARSACCGPRPFDVKIMPFSHSGSMSLMAGIRHVAPVFHRPQPTATTHSGASAARAHPAVRARNGCRGIPGSAHRVSTSSTGDGVACRGGDGLDGAPIPLVEPVETPRRACMAGPSRPATGLRVEAETVSTAHPSRWSSLSRPRDARVWRAHPASRACRDPVTRVCGAPIPLVEPVETPRRTCVSPPSRPATGLRVEAGRSRRRAHPAGRARRDPVTHVFGAPVPLVELVETP
jgi:hypothetical protein